MDSSLARHHMTAAMVTGMRAPAAAAPARRADSAVPLATVVALRPAARWDGRDGAERAMAVAAMDAQNRIAVAKIAAGAGWDPEGAPVVVTCAPGEVRARLGLQQVPTEIPARYVGGRLTLPAAARACLGVVAGDLVAAAAMAGGGELVLVAGADLAQLLTGAVAAPEAPAAPVRGRSRGVKAAFRPAAANE